MDAATAVGFTHATCLYIGREAAGQSRYCPRPTLGPLGRADPRSLCGHRRADLCVGAESTRSLSSNNGFGSLYLRFGRVCCGVGPVTGTGADICPHDQYNAGRIGRFLRIQSARASLAVLPHLLGRERLYETGQPPNRYWHQPAYPLWARDRAIPSRDMAF